MAEKKVYLGCQWGSFKDEKDGRTVRYAHLFVMEPFPPSDNPDFNSCSKCAIRARSSSSSFAGRKVTSR